MHEVTGAPAKVTEQEQQYLIETLKLLTGFQRQIIEVKKTLERLLKT